METLLQEFARTFGWSIVAALCMGLGTGLAIKLFDVMTPGVDEMQELKNGNTAVATVLAAVVLATGFVIGMALHQPN